ncbi:glucokinase [Pseudomonas oryzae]|uniref:Glucokinase n=1 Tax=Pseudomonas oryzae TaxID=1392877 RepID=A0A1H1N2Q5_9PSED|nr:glucokinase [Pseudomonas oryzae]SDR93264.1 glucokinase [Pseudomonas oryzae]
MKPVLVGDIGGTNARFGLWRAEHLEAVQVLATADFAGPQQAIEHYLAEQGLAAGDIAAVCLAVAGPVHGEHFHFTNNHWSLARGELAAALGLLPDDLLLVNDFTAMALGMTRLRPHEWLQICPGVAEAGSPVVVIGPGTGLGVGTLLPLGGGRWRALPGEGGHVDLPVGNPREMALWQVLYERLGHVRAEDVLSGNGLLQLYRASCSVDGHEPVLASPAEITAAALDGDAQAVAVLEQFCVWLGRVAGNNVLTLGARGGVYIVGGVVPRFAEFFKASGFARAFADKGCMSGYFDGIPVWLVTAEYPGLEGAGVALQQLL